MAGILSSKKYLTKIENELREYFGVKHVFLVSSGKAALFLILQSLRSLSPEKDEVLIPAYTCFSVPSAIIKAGLKVSLCDIDPSTFDFDYGLLEKTIDERTLCVIPDHLFGIPSDLDRINSLCKTRGIFVVEDTAQAMGGEYKGKMLGTVGDVGFFSLGRGKNITCGSGGIILTDSDTISHAIEEEYSRLGNPNRLESLKELIKAMSLSLFIRPSLFWFPAGLPFLKLGETIFYREFPVEKLSEMQAGLLKGWQGRLEESNQIHAENSRSFLNSLFSQKRYDGAYPYLRLPIRAANREVRNHIYSLSARKGLGMSLMYPTPVNEIDEISREFNGYKYPFAKSLSETILTIPTHQYLTEKDKERICETVKPFLQQPGLS